MASTEQLRAECLFSMKGKVCVVTGGGTGIGLMAAQALAANGAKVYIVGRRKEALENAAKHHSPTFDTGGSIIPCNPCDVREKDDLKRLAEEISEKEEAVHHLVTAAGIAGPKAQPDSKDAKEIQRNLWENESVEAWNETYSTDVTAVYFTCVAFLPLLQAASKQTSHLGASIITISSMSGLMNHAQGHFSYNTAKGAAVQLTKILSGELQKASIRVNSIAPGYFPSEMTVKESGPNQKSQMPDSKVQEKGHVPAGQPGADEEMAQAVLFLAKNNYVNGEIIAVDGGVMNLIAGR